MGTEGPVQVVDHAGFAERLLSERELIPRARRIASFLNDVFPESAVVVYVLEDSGWRSKATAGDVRVDTNSAQQNEAIQSVGETATVLVYQGADIAREAYAHLDLRRTVVSWAIVPLIANEIPVALVEIVTFADAIRTDSLTKFERIFVLAALGIEQALAYERERNSQLQSISRMTQFYDLEKTFNATIEVEELLPIIADKFRTILNVQAVNLWMVETKERLLLTNQSGNDVTVQAGATQQAGEGAAFHVSEAGEPLLIEDAGDERLSTRNRGVDVGAVYSLMAAPLMDKDLCVGVAEAINKVDGTPFDDDDLFLLSTICETASGALHNAGLLQSERKAQVLETLVAISNEITSTLNLDRVLQTVVNGPQAVIPYERSAIALEENGNLHLKAVSGARQINYGDTSIRELRDLIEWLSFSRDDLLVSWKDEEVAGAGDHRENFQHYFEKSGMCGIFARPLADDQGRLGMLVYESTSPDFLSPSHVELIKILSAQATVALRNAQLYQEVPFINLIEPLMERKRRFMALGKRRRIATGILAAVAVVFLIFFPVPLRVSGDVTVAPMRTALIQPEFDGVVRRVLVREGDAVRRGSIIAEMDDWDFRRVFAETQAKYRNAISEMNHSLGANDGSAAGLQRANVDFWSSEVSRARERVDRAKLRSPIDGVVSTPFIENFTGRKLLAGDKFAEVNDSSHATADVGMQEEDVPLLQEGMSTGVKLDSYPTRVFRGRIAVISPKSESVGDERFFFVRVDIPNPDGLLHPGMRGRGKVSAGWHPAGFVLLRRPAMWSWAKFWSWFGF